MSDEIGNETIEQSSSQEVIETQSNDLASDLAADLFPKYASSDEHGEDEEISASIDKPEEVKEEYNIFAFHKNLEASKRNVQLTSH